MKIFVDFDDTLAMSSVTVVQYLNERYGLNKAANDVHDWCYRSIYRHMTPKMVEDIYAGDYFWGNVNLFHDAVDTLRGHEVTVCSCGCSENLRRKAQFLSESNLGYGMAFINTEGGKKSGKDKCEFDMTGAVQIDDRVDSLLYTNAAVAPRATSASMFGARCTRLLKPLMKNLWFITMTMTVSSSCNSPIATWFPLKKDGSGQFHIICPIETYISTR